MHLDIIKKISKILVVLLIAVVVLSILYFAIMWFVTGNANVEPVIVVLEVLLLPFLFWCHKKLHKIENVYREQNEHMANSTPEFDIKILNSEVVDSPDRINYRFQVDFALHAFGKSVYIREIKLVQNNVIFTPQTIPINVVFSETKTDYLALSFEKYKQVIRELERIPTQGIIIGNDEWKYYTITDAITGERLPDGYENFVVKDWDFIIVYNDNASKSLKFNFDIHHNSDKTPTSFRYTNF